MFKKWVLFVSSRYTKNTRNGRVSTGILSAIGIAVGVLALISVISIMNGFQLGFIEDILEISSYHIRINGAETGRADEFAQIGGIKSVMPFYETQTLINSPYNIEPCLVKGLPDDAVERDPSFFRQLNIYRGDFRPDTAGSIVIGRILSYKLGLSIGDTVSLIALNGDAFRSLRPETSEFVITGLFQSGYDDFDASMIIMSDKSLTEIDSSAKLKYGIKLENRFGDRKVLGRLETEDGIGPDKAISWREYNRAFFSALKLEKTMMTVLLGLIFLVVSFGIFNSTRRAIAEKQEEIGILRAIGATPSQIRQIFVINGFLIGAVGGTVGVFAGLAVSMNINGILRLLALNSSSFLINVPVRILPSEVAMIFVFALIFCTAAAFTASAKISRITPQEVLRYE